uniref:Zinc finger protein 26 n=1 Tax=Cacopsylla melanoneura TaxID=428564 RepID=A0A8D8S124_9HEMI
MADLKITRQELISLCRLCLAKDLASIDIFETGSEVRQLFTKIVACLPIQVSTGDSLPHKICQVCNSKVDDFYQFWTSTAKNQKQLNEWLQISIEEDQKTVEPTIKVEADDTRQDGDYDEYDDGGRGDDSDDDDEEDAPSAAKRIKTQDSGDEDQKPTDLDAILENSTDVNGQKDGSSKKKSKEKQSNVKLENLELPVQRTCRICAQRFENLYVLRKHMRLLHPGELNFPCYLCDVSLSNKYQKKKHYKSVHKGMPYFPTFTCPICKKTFKNQEFYSDHVSAHEGKRRHVCDVCGSDFSTFYHLSNHKRVHYPQPKKIYECKKCDSKFSSRSALSYHKYKIHEKKSWQCPTCGKVLAAYDRNHLRIHEKEQKYVCETCGKRFNCPQYLKDHTLSHGPVKPFKCYYCEKRFTQRTPRSIHIRKFHTKETRYECNTCTVKFVTKDLLKKHMHDH